MYKEYIDGVDMDILEEYIPHMKNPNKDKIPNAAIETLKRQEKWRSWKVPTLPSIGKILDEAAVKDSKVPVTFLTPDYFDRLRDKVYNEIPATEEPEKVAYAQAFELRACLRYVHEDLRTVKSACKDFLYADNFIKAVKDYEKARMLYICAKVRRISNEALGRGKPLTDEKRKKLQGNIIARCEETEKTLTLLDRAEKAYRKTFPDYAKTPDSVDAMKAVDFFSAFSSSSVFDKLIMRGTLTANAANARRAAEKAAEE